LRLLHELIASLDLENPTFRPTEIFNESWLVKLVVHQASSMRDQDFPLGFFANSKWFSEALLPTPFRARYRGDPLAESRTNADIVIGHFLVGERGKADIELADEPCQFTVIEAKIAAPLSKDTTRAKSYDQAARTVACMAEATARADVSPSALERLDFIVLAPRQSIESGTFAHQMRKDSIRSKVQRRVSEYAGALDAWYVDHFEPTLDHIDLQCISWEEAIEWIGRERYETSTELQKFYEFCLQFS